EPEPAPEPEPEREVRTAVLEPQDHLPSSVPESGELSTLPLPRLIFELYKEGYSGALRLERKGVERVIVFRTGYPVHVVSSRLDENLGQLLVQHGRITPKNYDEIQHLVGEKGFSQGAALIKIGSLTQAELLDGLKMQTEVKLSNSFAWREGSFAVDIKTHFEGRVPTEVEPLPLIWRGVSEHYDLMSLLKFFAALGKRHIVATKQLVKHFQSIGPLMRQIDSAVLLDGKHTVEDFLRYDDSRAAEITRALYVLFVTDMVRIRTKVGPAFKPPRLIDDESGEKKKAASYQDVSAACERVAETYLDLRDKDLFSIFGISEKATSEEVEAAYQSLIARVNPKELPLGVPDDVIRRAGEILLHLKKGRGLLLSPDDRQRYQEDLAAREAKKAAMKAAQKTAQITGILPTSEPKPELADMTPKINSAHSVEAEKSYGSARSLLTSGDVQGAMDAVRHSIKLIPKEPLYHSFLARLWLANKSVNAEISRGEAVSAVNHALDLDPGHIDANLVMAGLLLSLGRSKRAQAYVERVLQREPLNEEARKIQKRLLSDA
ncbi:tetratricopeptide repeat protein, partial [Myxococcota bacterium]|nr:tetratricopeptide repeat protein [Myxococcota bacterium]